MLRDTKKCMGEIVFYFLLAGGLLNFVMSRLGLNPMSGCPDVWEAYE